ncbi:MAG: hypothetical protein R3304_00985 [Longimicrobiales bacterium]|nr:hypothetical protein [Longimicrobiales bacterium]
MTVEPTPAYRAATAEIAVFDSDGRTLFTVTGRSPARMLNGVLSGAMPPPPREVEPGVWEGGATYHAVLTPKGKMISDLRATLLGEEDGPGFLLDVPDAGRSQLREHFTKFLPPRFAKVEDVSEELDALTVVGPGAAEALSRLALGLRVDASWLSAAPEGAWRSAGLPPQSLLVARTADVWPAAWTVYGPVPSVRSLKVRLVEEGAVVGDVETWETLRVETGRPAYGKEMDQKTLPPEAGIVDRAIDHAKGCYTGQEVIVRIRDRGHVNRELRRLRLGEGPSPDVGAELLATDGSEKVVGAITSVVRSPKAGEVLALAYVRREAEEVLLGDRTVTVPEGFPRPLED